MATDVKKLARLWENAENGDEAEMEELLQFLDSEGLSIEEGEALKDQSFEPTAETHVEERELKKGKAVDDRKSSRDALPLDKIAGAFGVDLKAASEEGELDEGGLEGYLQGRGVNFRVDGESKEEYRDRMTNAFEQLGLNFNSKEDRALVTNSLAHYGLMDKRTAIKDEAGSGVTGFFTRLIAPRTFEQAERDIMNGEGESDGIADFVLANAKNLGLDAMEDVAMTAGNPVTGPLKAASEIKFLQNAYKNFKKGKKLLDGRTKANKALKGAGTLAGMGADAAAVPFAFEGLDAAAYDDPENTRSEFDLGDAMLGTAVNLAAPWYLRRKSLQNKRLVGEDVSEVEKAAQNIKNVMPDIGLKKYIIPFGTNKLGTADATRSNYLIEQTGIREEQQKRDEKAEKQSRTRTEKHDKWSRGLGIPMPGDKDYEEFQKWLNKNRGNLAKYL